MNDRRVRRVWPWPAPVGVALATVLTSMAAEPTSKPAAAPTTDQGGPVIKDVYRKHFLIGTAGDFPGNYSDGEKALVKTHFNVLTPENCMKPAPVHPQEDTWRFERTDALVAFAAENGLAIQAHTLVWHAQTNNSCIQA